MFQITVLFLYIIAGICFALSRWPSTSGRAQLLVTVSFFLGFAGVICHAAILWPTLRGLTLSIADAASFVGLQLALIALLGGLNATLRGLSGGLLILAALAAVLSSGQDTSAASSAVDWQLKTHVLISLFAYGLLTAGAIVAVYALLQDRRLRMAKISAANQLFAPLVTTEKLLFAITTTGFTSLLLAVVSGLTFVENLFAQHLVHKTVLSLIALVLFGVLAAGRTFAGWRGHRAVYLYLWGFAVLCLAYFGSRIILENILGRSWT